MNYQAKLFVNLFKIGTDVLKQKAEKEIEKLAAPTNVKLIDRRLEELDRMYRLNILTLYREGQKQKEIDKKRNILNAIDRETLTLKKERKRLRRLITVTSASYVPRRSVATTGI